jgi:hypothetical protein
VIIVFAMLSFPFFVYYSRNPGVEVTGASYRGRSWNEEQKYYTAIFVICNTIS